LSAGALPQTPLGKLTALPQTSYLVYGVGPPGKRKEIGGRRKGRGARGEERKGGEVVPECPNPELASLVESYVMITAPDQTQLN